MTGYAIGIGISQQSGWSALVQLENGAPVRIFLLENGTVEVETDSDQISVTISNSIYYDGQYTVLLTDFEQGPVNLVAPVLVDGGSAAVESTLSIIPGLWITNAVRADPVISYTASGENVVDASDPSAPTLSVSSSDAGTQLNVIETATDSAGVRHAQSNTVGVPAATQPITLEDSAVLNSGVSSTSATFSNANLGAAAAGRELFIAVGGFRTGSSAADVFSLTVDGISADKVAEAVSEDNVAVVALFKSTVAATTADIVLSVGNGTISRQRCGIHVVRVVNAGGTTTGSTLEVDASGNSQANLDLSVLNGDFAIAAAFKSGNTSQPTSSGLTLRGAPYSDIDTGEFLSLAFDTVTETETRSIAMNADETAPKRHVAVAAAFT
jgi:hypothetical protein